MIDREPLRQLRTFEVGDIAAYRLVWSCRATLIPNLYAIDRSTREISSRCGNAVRERQDIVYCDGREGAIVKTTEKVASPQRQPSLKRVVVVPSPVLLFRFSALTFNGRRTHYDRNYCLEEDGYPGLVAHGLPFRPVSCRCLRLNCATNATRKASSFGLHMTKESLP